jgi:hypothetical protein
MTTPTFQELLTSQEARDRVEKFYPDKAHGSHWMSTSGLIYPSGKHPTGVPAIWQGWLTDCAPPPKPRVFKAVRYFNVYGDGIWELGHSSSDHAKGDASEDRLACVRVEITAIEGQYDD